MLVGFVAVIKWFAAQGNAVTGRDLLTLDLNNLPQGLVLCCAAKTCWTWLRIFAYIPHANMPLKPHGCGLFLSA